MSYLSYSSSSNGTSYSGGVREEQVLETSTESVEINASKTSIFHRIRESSVFQLGKLPIFLFVLLILLFMFTRNHRLVTVSGNSMFPTLYDGSIVISSYARIPEVGELYCIVEPDDENTYAVKRLIGIPGDCIQIIDGVTYRNGELFMEATGDSWDNFEWNLRSDEYLFLGDNRSLSYDGRYWSRALTMDDILYKLDFVVYPYTKIGRVG